MGVAATRQSIAWAVLLNNRGVFLPSPTVTQDAWLATLALLALLLFYRVLVRGRLPGRAPVLGAAAGAGVLGLAALWLMEWDMPMLRGLNVRGGITLVPELVVLVTALSVYTAAFVAETIRSGFLAVQPGQWEAGAAASAAGRPCDG
jgi:general L-amino acid transport system permease protein